MSYIFLPTDLSIIALYDGGVPNLERVCIRIPGKVNLAKYALVVGWRNQDNVTTPMRDFFWLGEREIEGPYILYLYTGSGVEKLGKLDNGQPYLTMHLGSDQTLFNNQFLVPILMQIGGVNVGKHFDLNEQKFLNS